jgi:hypothetical protein
MPKMIEVIQLGAEVAYIAEQVAAMILAVCAAAMPER